MILCIQNSMETMTESNSVVALGLAAMWSRVGGVRGLQRNLGGDRYVHYLDGFTGV